MFYLIFARRVTSLALHDWLYLHHSVQLNGMQ